jgi:hypothetical protein
MLAWVHFLAVLGSAAAALFLCVRFFGKPTLWRVLAALASLLAPACGAGAGLHRCDSGTPLTQWLVPGLAAVLIVLLVEPLRWRIAGGLGCALLSVGLSFHYADAVHGPIWIGNPDSFTLDGQRAERRWHTPVTGLYLRVPDPSHRPARASG